MNKPKLLNQARDLYISILYEQFKQYPENRIHLDRLTRLTTLAYRRYQRRLNHVLFTITK